VGALPLRASRGGGLAGRLVGLAAEQACYADRVNESEISSSVLIAMPQLADPNFKRTVVLMIHHDEGGSFGLVLNRPVDLSANDLCSSLDVQWCGDPSTQIFCGGPVQPNAGFVLFSEDLSVETDPGEVTEVNEGVLFGSSLAVLRSLAESPPAGIRLMLGYSGWGEGQLESEMAQGAWLVAPSNYDLIFEVPIEAMWEHAVRGLGIDPATLIPVSGIH